MSHREFYRRDLPHWQPSGATLFVTFRLAGSLPRALLAQLAEDRAAHERSLEQITASEVRKAAQLARSRQVFAAWEKVLDAMTVGPRWLATPRVAALVAEALHYRHGRVYDLLAFCIMPNHVHVVFTPLEKPDGTYYALQKIMQTLKGYTGHLANEILQRTGPFWQDESYDHVVRDGNELERIVAYTLHNPVKAGLVDAPAAWPWNYLAHS